jgi:hypothetical protein
MMFSIFFNSLRFLLYSFKIYISFEIIFLDVVVRPFQALNREHNRNAIKSADKHKNKSKTTSEKLKRHDNIDSSHDFFKLFLISSTNVSASVEISYNRASKAKVQCAANNKIGQYTQHREREKMK